MTMLTRAPANGQARSRMPQLPRRRVHLPYLGIGVLLVVLGAIGFGALASGSATTGTALAAAHDIAAGHQLTDTDLVAVHVSAESGAQLVPAAQLSSLLGRRAAVPLPAGALLSPQSVRAGPALNPGAAIVAVVLAPGTAPVADLRAGDHVAVVATTATADGSTSHGVLADAEVVRVDTIKSGPTTSGSMTVSLQVPSAAAAQVAEAAAGDHVRLVLTAPGDNLASSSGR